ncbi:MAG: hypothetical protein IKO52_07625 [Clostridia bacterium]|nr:hypothetical protein [Clostridia bacterium]
MKIKIRDRLILFCGALLTIAAGVMLFIHGIQEKNTLFLVGAVVLAAFGGYLIAFPFLYKAKRNDFVIQRTDSGELRIAVKAIENQVQKCIDLHEEIQASAMKILSSREGVVVDLTVTLSNDISIPLAVASLQKQIKQYLIASSGIEVKEVRVSVESTQDSVSPEAPEAEDEQPAEKNAAIDVKEKKAPMHQRLFGRADEPAIVPEPPKEEEPMEDEETATEAETEEAAEVEEAREQPGLIPDEPKQETDLPPEETPAGEMEEEAPSEDDSIPKEEIPEEPAIEEEEPKKKPEPLPESDITPESEEKTDE